MGFSLLFCPFSVGKNWCWRRRRTTPPNHIINATYFLFPLLSFSVWRETEWGGILFSFPSTNEGFGYFSFISFHPRGGENTFEIVKLRPSHSRIGLKVSISPFSSQVTVVFWGIAVFWVLHRDKRVTFQGRVPRMSKIHPYTPISQNHPPNEGRREKSLCPISLHWEKGQKYYRSSQIIAIGLLAKKTSISIPECRFETSVEFSTGTLGHVPLYKKITCNWSVKLWLVVPAHWTSKGFHFYGKSMSSFRPPVQRKFLLRERSKGGSCCTIVYFCLEKNISLPVAGNYFWKKLLWFF